MMKVWHRTQMYVQKLFHNRDMFFYSHNWILSQFFINMLLVQSVDLTLVCDHSTESWSEDL